MKLTVAVKSNGKWSLLECVAIDRNELSKLLKKRFKNVDAVVELESEELPAVDV